MQKTTRAIFLSTLLMAIGIGSALAQPTVSLNSVGAAPGGNAELEWTLTDPNGTVHGLEFDVTIPAELDASTVSCTATATVNQTPSCNQQGTTNVYRIAVTDTSTDPIPAGVIGTLTVPLPDPLPAGLTFPISLPVTAAGGCFDLIGDPIACNTGDGEITEQTASLAVGDAALGSVEIGSTSTAQNVLIENNTGADINPTVATLTGTNPGDFTLANGDCMDPLADGATCNLSATCTPTAAGAREATVELTAGTFSDTGTLTCTGTIPAEVIVGDAAFGDVVVGTTSGAQTVTVTNGTAAPVDATAFDVGGTNATDFTVTAGTCTATLAAGASCDLSATCTPSATGARTATVSYTGVTDTGTLTCNGTEAPTANLTASPNPVNLMMQGDSETVTLTNNGDAIANLGTFPAAPEGFTITGNTCGTELAANGGTCEFVVTYTGTDPVMATISVGGLDIRLNGGQAPIAIPTLSQWSMILVASVLAMLAMFGMRRKEG